MMAKKDGTHIHFRECRKCGQEFRTPRLFVRVCPDCNKSPNQTTWGIDCSNGDNPIL